MAHLYHWDYPDVPADFREDFYPDRIWATLDQFSRDGSDGLYGEPFGLSSNGKSGELIFGLPSLGAPLFAGKPDAQNQRIAGQWTHPVPCGPFLRMR